MISMKAKKKEQQKVVDRLIAAKSPPGAPLNRQQRRIKIAQVRPMIRKARRRAILAKLTEKRRAMREPLED